jgi:hypothetical protein
VYSVYIEHARRMTDYPAYAVFSATQTLDYRPEEPETQGEYQYLSMISYWGEMTGEEKEPYIKVANKTPLTVDDLDSVTRLTIEMAKTPYTADEFKFDMMLGETFYDWLKKKKEIEKPERLDEHETYQLFSEFQESRAYDDLLKYFSRRSFAAKQKKQKKQKKQPRQQQQPYEQYMATQLFQVKEMPATSKQAGKKDQCHCLTNKGKGPRCTRNTVPGLMYCAQHKDCGYPM